MKLNDGLDFDVDPQGTGRSLAELLEQPLFLPAWHKMLNAMPKPSLDEAYQSHMERRAGCDEPDDEDRSEPDMREDE